MSTLGNVGPIVPPDLRSVFDTERTAAAVSINKIQIGIIQSFNPTKQSATVQLVNQRVVFNTPMTTSAIPSDPTIYPYPLLVDVPVWMLSGGKGYVTMPISEGDPCIVLFNDRDLDPWWTNGTTGAPPNSSRIHSLADGMALVGIQNATTALANIPTDGQHIGIGNTSGTLAAAIANLCTAVEQLCTDLGTAVISGTAFNAATIAKFALDKTAVTTAAAAIAAIIQ